jgi:hypothetical protein
VAAAVKEWWLKTWIGGLRGVVEPGTDVVGDEGIVYTLISGRSIHTVLGPLKEVIGKGPIHSGWSFLGIE